MAKRRSAVRRKSHRENPVTWLPIDSRIFTPLFSFGHVHGPARLFLIIEIILSFAMVIGSIALLVLSVFSR